MQSTLETSAVMEKTRELCQAIVSQPDFQDLRRHIDTFMADEQAKLQYQTVAEKGEQLHAKQHQGVHLTTEEISDYEQHREVLVNNPVAKNFLAAQEQMREVQASVQRYVNKTLELGRLPEPEDFESCGHGCSCGH